MFATYRFTLNGYMSLRTKQVRFNQSHWVNGSIDKYWVINDLGIYCIVVQIPSVFRPSMGHSNNVLISLRMREWGFHNIQRGWTPQQKLTYGHFDEAEAEGEQPKAGSITATVKTGQRGAS